MNAESYVTIYTKLDQTLIVSASSVLLLALLHSHVEVVIKLNNDAHKLTDKITIALLHLLT